MTEPDPLRYCTICMGPQDGGRAMVEATHIASVFDNGKEQRPSQFFVCPEHMDAAACTRWLDCVYPQLVPVSFTPLPEFFQEVRDRVAAEDSVERLRSPIDDINVSWPASAEEIFKV